MKKFISALLSTLLFLIPCGSGCGLLDSFVGIFGSDKEIVDEQFHKLITVMEEQDEEGLRALFSINAIEQDSTFDKEIDSLFEYWQGEVISQETREPFVEEEVNEGARRKILESSCEVVTTADAYRLYVQYVDIDEQTPANEGIWSFYIIKQKDDTTYEEGWPYAGDANNTPGINIAVLNSYVWES